MIAIVVDDEALMLRGLMKAVSVSPDISKVVEFSNGEDALSYVKNNQIDLAFLDINMRGMGGLALAENIIKFQPNSKIVFCTGYEEYAIPAFKLHASGYLMKPISAEDVQGEIDNIKGIRQKEKLLEEQKAEAARIAQEEEAARAAEAQRIAQEKAEHEAAIRREEEERLAAERRAKVEEERRLRRENSLLGRLQKWGKKLADDIVNGEE